MDRLSTLARRAVGQMTEADAYLAYLRHIREHPGCIGARAMDGRGFDASRICRKARNLHDEWRRAAVREQLAEKRPA